MAQMSNPFAMLDDENEDPQQLAKVAKQQAAKAQAAAPAAEAKAPSKPAGVCMVLAGVTLCGGVACGGVHAGCVLAYSGGWKSVWLPCTPTLPFVLTTPSHLLPLPPPP